MWSQVASSVSQGRKSRKVSRGFIILFSLAFFLPGLALAIFIGFHNWACYQQSTWQLVGANVLGIAPDARDEDERIRSMEYQYRFDGETFVIRDGASGLPMMYSDSDKMKLVQQARQALQAGDFLPCLVNPVNPSDHTLQPTRPQAGIYFMGIFTFSHGLLGLLLGLSQLIGSQSDTPTFAGQSKSKGTYWHCIWLAVTVLSLNAYGIPSALSLWWPPPMPAEGCGIGFVGDSIPKALAWTLLCVPLLTLYLWWRSLRKQWLERDLQLALPAGGLQAGRSFVLRLQAGDSGQMLPSSLHDTRRWVLSCTAKENYTDSDGDAAKRDVPLDKVELESVMEGNGIRLSGSLPSTAQGSSDDIRWELTGKSRQGITLGPFSVMVRGE
jgi:hypothetical protein